MKALSNKLYKKLRFVLIVIIIVSVFIIGVNLVKNYEPGFKSGTASYETDNNISFAEENAEFIIDLNSASFEELKKLSGVGDIIAERIIEYRIDTGGFENVNELLLIEGISESKYKNILPYVTVINTDNN